jgi:hypothetical protein
LHCRCCLERCLSLITLHVFNRVPCTMSLSRSNVQKSYQEEIIIKSNIYSVYGEIKFVTVCKLYTIM